MIKTGLKEFGSNFNPYMITGSIENFDVDPKPKPQAPDPKESTNKKSITKARDQQVNRNPVAPLPGHGLDKLQEMADQVKQVTGKSDQAPDPQVKTTAKKGSQQQPGALSFLKNKKVIYAAVIILILIGVLR